ncbi:hypothetical protein BDW02DRAFT_575562 [Decorospora gaudefroyi]|uniref:Uncharacterized protein n=1 Tax=Decorospora gaudefroyi TaxID=184978 RepID=A0A6A5KXI8_9PLEO|nr:hypothetical protein BDW02DRAFT_575562 [Decorospora gaudefroyi]
MSSQAGSSSSNNDVPKVKLCATGDNNDPATDIRTFLSQMPTRKNAVLPLNPWTVPAGYYVRTDGTIMYIEREKQLRGNNQTASVNSSMECLIGAGVKHDVQRMERRAASEIK